MLKKKHLSTKKYSINMPPFAVSIANRQHDKSNSMVINTSNKVTG